MATGGGASTAENTRAVVLVADGDGMVRRSIARMLTACLDCVAHEAATADAVVPAVERFEPDLVLWHPQLGLEQPRRIRSAYSRCAVIAMSGSAEVDDVCAALDAGAAWYVVKPRLTPHTVGSLLQRHALRRAPRKFLGESRAARAVRATIDRIATSDLPVLVLGPTGSGKDLVARVLHEQSGRRGPFVARNCAAMPEGLIDEMLFGHERGAFTGAVARGEGAFQAADGGTLLLDEIAELPMQAQAKLLRALQERTVLPLGATREVSVNVRVIAATNANLRERVARGQFREDLYYRLDVLSIGVPSLAERVEDIDMLVRAFAADTPRRLTFHDDAMGVLRRHTWPGNVRELWASVHKLAVLADSASVGVSDVERVLTRRRETSAHDLARAWLMLSHEESPEQAFQRALFLEAWTIAGGEVAEVARLLQIDRWGVMRRRQKYAPSDRA